MCTVSCRWVGYGVRAGAGHPSYRPHTLTLPYTFLYICTVLELCSWTIEAIFTNSDVHSCTVQYCVRQVGGCGGGGEAGIPPHPHPLTLPYTLQNICTVHVRGLWVNIVSILPRQLGDTYVVRVLDKRIRNIPEVVLVKRGVVGFLGIWKGGGLGEGWGKWGQFTSNLRPRWTIPVTAGGFQVSRRGSKGRKGEPARGD
jgi:hypothetical protein